MKDDIVTIQMTRAQAEYVEKCVDARRIKGSKGREFAAWRAIKKALGTWKEENKTK